MGNIEPRNYERAIVSPDLHFARRCIIDKESHQNSNAVIDLSPFLPIRLGIKELNSEFEGGLPLFHMVLIKPETMEIFLTTEEKHQARIEELRAQAEELRVQIEEEKKPAVEE